MYISSGEEGGLKENLQTQMKPVYHTDNQRADDEQFYIKVTPGLILAAYIYSKVKIHSKYLLIQQLFIQNNNFQGKRKECVTFPHSHPEGSGICHVFVISECTRSA
jgi:hypothetical protein